MTTFTTSAASFVAPLLLLLATGCAPATSQSQDIDTAKGADDSVDYEALRDIGPWDDRNLTLTAEDLELLSDNESELGEPIPVFFRVLLRRANPKMQSAGPAQYPRSALQTFFQLCGGYLLDGKYYSSTTVEDGRYKVMTGNTGDELKNPTVTSECQPQPTDKSN